MARNLTPDDRKVTCEGEHEYPIIQGVPILLVDELEATHAYCNETLIGQTTKRQTIPSGAHAVDAFVQDEIGRTCGNMYWRVHRSLNRYPIPNIPVPEVDGEWLLDIGCNWGRWTMAAARKGYRAVGVDPSLDAVLAALRVARQLKLDISVVVGDARCLPFADGSFDNFFSNGVFQHFAKSDARQSWAEAARVTKLGGTVTIQMANARGILQTYRRWVQKLRGDESLFRIRYWTQGSFSRNVERRLENQS